MESYLKHVQQDTEDVKRQILEVNKERKNDQTEASKRLASLENKWSDLIAQNLQVEIACAALESEIEELRRYKQSAGGK
jgi:pre-mRNA-splicing factor SPF27